MFVAFNNKKIVTAISNQPFSSKGNEVVEMEDYEEKEKLIGKTLEEFSKGKNTKDLKIAFICNWDAPCGISTYSKFLIDAIKPKVKQIHIFSEIQDKSDTQDVTYCWERGKPLQPMIKKIKDWQPDFIIIQHEFGIFPKATYFLQLLQGINDIPYAITMHSVYEHLDKTICTAAIKNIIVHSQEAKDALFKKGHNGNVFVIPHGCTKITNNSELWNIFQTPYCIVQFGFGFYYKGVDKALDAIGYLKKTDPKFKDIFYCYLCSENEHTNNIHAQYYNYLLDKIDHLDIKDNVAIIKKFQTEETITNYLRTAKLALFPYVSDPKNVVYGASGAIRIAMACQIPIIASNSKMFDDLEGVVPRPSDYLEIAKEIDEIFSNDKYRNKIIENVKNHIENNSWDIIADKYLTIYSEIRG